MQTYKGDIKLEPSATLQRLTVSNLSRNLEFNEALTGVHNAGRSTLQTAEPHKENKESAN
jgi:hypothetical protein